MVTKAESALHEGLVRDLLSWFEQEKGYRITGADLKGYTQPQVVKNSDGVGDGENKMPDVDAFDDSTEVYVRGEAKTGDGDLNTEHSKTQFLLFANRHNKANGKSSLLYIIVPESKIDELKAVLREIGLLDRDNVVWVKSGKYA
ncbi:MAG: hypothetical protein IH865_08855 [Chloroflexi bacterium]|nr:hypothetical protein [Chloroflexota bacterium]